MPSTNSQYTVSRNETTADWYVTALINLALYQAIARLQFVDISKLRISWNVLLISRMITLSFEIFRNYSLLFIVQNCNVNYKEKISQNYSVHYLLARNFTVFYSDST